MLYIQALDELLNVDIDSVDPAVAKRVTDALGHRPRDQTSNPVIIKWAAEDPARREDLEQSIRARYKEGGWVAVHDHFTVLLCHRNSFNISGRVLIQCSALDVDSTDKVLAHARNIAREFELVGLNKDQFALKIPITGPAAVACRILEEEGIRTLGTTIYCVAQGIAASQAGCLYISPYYNESPAHIDPVKFWPNKRDPAKDHPMSSRVLQIAEVYRRLYKETGKEQPLIKLAGFVNFEEAVGAAELGAHSTTIVPKVLDELCAKEAPGPLRGNPKSASFYANVHDQAERLTATAAADPLGHSDWDGKLPSTSVDYLANGGAALEAALKADKVALGRMNFSLKRFADCDLVCRDIIEKLAQEIL